MSFSLSHSDSTSQGDQIHFQAIPGHSSNKDQYALDHEWQVQKSDGPMKWVGQPEIEDEDQ